MSALPNRDTPCTVFINQCNQNNTDSLVCYQLFANKFTLNVYMYIYMYVHNRKKSNLSRLWYIHPYVYVHTFICVFQCIGLITIFYATFHTLYVCICLIFTNVQCSYMSIMYVYVYKK